MDLSGAEHFDSSYLGMLLKPGLAGFSQFMLKMLCNHVNNHVSYTIICKKKLIKLSICLPKLRLRKSSFFSHMRNCANAYECHANLKREFGLDFTIL